MGTTRLNFARAIIQRIGADRTTDREMALVAIMTGENSRATWNALDTTLPEFPRTPYNSFGPFSQYHVWSYERAADGIEATVLTMRQANMKPWYEVFTAPRVPALEICRAFSEVPWASIGDVLPADLVTSWANKSRRYASDADTWVEGNGPWPYRRNGKPA